MTSNNGYFFDSYPDFFETSIVGSTPNRLNNRFKALIENNREIIKNSVVLDLGSHDGRWSFAALLNGASKVIGVEGRKELVDICYHTMKKYRIHDEKYSFIVGDVFDEIKNIDEKIDIVFCFGIFYHIMNHVLLLQSIKRLQPNYIIIDSAVSNSESPIIEIRLENINNPAAAIKGNVAQQAVVGRPSKKAIELMLTNLGFNFSYYNWQSSGIVNWKDIEDYKNGERISMVAKNMDFQA